MKTQATRVLQPRVVIIGGLGLLLMALFLVVVAAPAGAAFPGGNGKIAFSSNWEGNHEIYTMNADGTAQYNLTNIASNEYDPAWSPDGTKIAFTSDNAGNNNIVLMNADGTGWTMLTTNAADDQRPAWSPDGKMITFQSSRDGNWEIYTMNADGTGQTNRTNTSPGNEGEPAWSPDGSKIAFTSDRDGNREIYDMNPNGTGQTNLTNRGTAEYDPFWSPDGSKIAFTSNNNSWVEDIYVMNANGADFHEVTSYDHNRTQPAWSPDGTKITYTWDADGNPEIYSMKADGTGQFKMTNTSIGVNNWNPDWQPQPNYHWTWYDNIGGDNWVLMANPASAVRNLYFGLSVGGIPRDLSGYNNGVVAPGQSITPKYSGLMGGPVKATSTSGGYGILSQRILWPHGGNSLEEVLGTAESKLSSHFYWTWYDQLSPGFTNWVLISNPGSGSVYYEITIAGADPGAGSKGTISPGHNVTPTFPGKMGGPVEVRAWTDSNKTTPAKIMASQRVLSNGGAAFNEVPGIPAEELSSMYAWTWYDDVGGSNWVLIANPNNFPLYYTLQVGNNGCNINPPPGTACLKDNGTPIPAGGYITPRLGVMNGPTLLATYSDAPHNNHANSIASQRSLWGPSFEEVPGLSYQGLSANYHWTWYDQQSAGATNWVLIANPDFSDTIKVEIWMNGQRVQEGAGPGGTPTTWTLAPGEKATPRFGSYMGGPVEVRAYVDGGIWNGNNGADNRAVITSQRVLWNGYFNEVLGTVLD